MTVATEKPVLAYSLAELAAASGVSVDMVQRAKKDGSLPVRFVGSKAVVDVDDAKQWIKSLPTERGAA